MLGLDLAGLARSANVDRHRYLLPARFEHFSSDNDVAWWTWVFGDFFRNFLPQ